MAIDAYLQIDGVKGESQDEQHKNWIECLSINWGVLYFSIELENVLVGHVSPDLHPGSFLAEHVGLKYSKIKWRYTQQKVGGGAGGSTIGGWDLATNRIA